MDKVARLVDKTMDLVDILASLVDKISSLVDKTMDLVDILASLVNKISSLVDKVETVSPNTENPP